jgi:uncharacterized membrane protein YfcA
MREFLVSNPVNDIVLMGLVTTISVVTTIGGVGGGGLLIPLYMLAGNFQLNDSIKMTVMTIFGDTAVRIWFLYNKLHPLETKRHLIYFPPLLIVTLFDANTSFFGVILSNLSPKVMTISCLCLILTSTFYKSISKAIDTFVKETKYLEDPNSGLELVVVDGIGEYFSIHPKQHPQSSICGESTDIDIHDESKIDDINLEDQTNTIEHGDSKSQQYFDTLLIFVNVGTISIFSITRSYFKVCEITYWVHVLGQFLATGLLGYYSVSYIMSDYNKKRENKYIFIDGDIVWNRDVVQKFVMIGSVTGFVSTYIGIGGGMLTTPIMITVGMLPEVVVATSSISTLVSCIISSLNYLASDGLPFAYGTVFAVCSGIGSVGGIFASNYILEHYKRQSNIIFVVGLIIFSSIIFLIVNAIESNLFLDTTFKNICI